MHAASPNIGLQELFPFALNCPDLEELGLFIDANFSDTLAASDWRVPPTSFRKLRVLDVGKSAIAKGAERAVARFLSLVCTPGCVIKYHDPSNKDNLVAEQWKVVNDMLPQLFSLRVWYERRMAYELERAGNPCN
ncbi:hypothetical protein VKT23_012015 [Stygiomarasmius scandens]|uniref:Uncharacterized protein n=1 Tax=Marasmiellus scandens TaxID=2682957 RepID=A0ABR1JBL3_9AGAR